ncbi:MAG: Ig-like domain-containing protein, partial [Campylobacterales bacterium]|nr:Ig-like domain-containing protein [Campylobacterales bacterium]
MFLPLLLLAFIISFNGCLSKERTADDSAFKNVSSGSSGPISVKTVFPMTPVVTLGGTLRLTSVVTDISGNYLQSTEANPVTVTWTSSDTSVVTVDNGGTLYGKKEGEATISLMAKQGSSVSETYTLKVNVVN